MDFHLIEHPDPQAFARAMIPLLIEFEAAYCVHIGLLTRLAEKGYSPMSADELPRPLLLTVENSNGVELIATHNFQKKLLMTRGSDEAGRFLADQLAQRQWDGNGAIGYAPSGEAFSRRFAELTSRTAQVTLRLHTFQLDKVIWPAKASGRMRLCMPEDRDVLAKYLTEFAGQIREPTTESPLKRADWMIENERAYFWMDGEPVALAAWAGRTPHGIRISTVYTPEQLRRRGYATNLVAHLTQTLLDEGRQFCFLNTDAANPTSNSIYQKIGYQFVGQAESWEIV